MAAQYLLSAYNKQRRQFHLGIVNPDLEVLFRFERLYRGLNTERAQIKQWSSLGSFVKEMDNEDSNVRAAIKRRNVGPRIKNKESPPNKSPNISTDQTKETPLNDQTNSLKLETAVSTVVRA